MPPLVIIAQPHLRFLTRSFDDRYEVLPLWDEPSRSRLAEASVLVTAGEYRFAPGLLDAMPRLGLIACFTVGYDGVDIAEARARGIAVSHARNANVEDVADHAIGLIVGHRRCIVEGDRQLRAGGWSADAKRVTRSLGGAKLGIVGLGGIGAAIARRAEAMRMQIGWWGPSAKPDAPWPRADSLLALARDSDILAVAARAHDTNRKLIAADIIEALGPGGLLVNVARGQLVDEDALIDALRSGRLGGAALDVYAEEPTPAERWVDVPNTVLTPHTGGATREAVERMTAMLLANVTAFFAGEALPTPVV